MRLDDLAGMGPRMAARLRQRFGDEDAALDALRAAHIERLAAVPGVSAGRAVAWAKAVRGDQDVGEVAATPAAGRLLEDILERIRSFAATPSGRDRLRLLGPLPDPDSARTRMQEVLAAKALVADLDRDAVRAALRRMRPVEDGKPQQDAGLVVIAESQEAYDRLHELGVGRWAALGSARRLRDVSPDETVVIAYDEGRLCADGDNMIEVPADAELAEFCPQSVLSLVRRQRDVVEACDSLAALLDRPTVASDLMDAIGSAAPQTGGRLDARKEAERLRVALDAELEERLEGLQVTGAAALHALAAGRPPPELERIQAEVVDEGNRRFHEATGLDADVFQPGLPVLLDDKALRAAIQAHEGATRTEAFLHARSAAHRVNGMLPALRGEIDHWLRFDETFALGCFAHEHDLHAPVVGEGFAFTSSIHLDLATDTEAQWIGYELGGEASTALLTGANSGGKTTFLEHLGQLALMTRLGLPVPGRDVGVPWIEELHLITATKSLDAGALETFLRSFVPLGQTGPRRLVLADEVEAITELEAAARILAFVIRRLADTESLAVVATHLAPQIREHVPEVRIDGIEATGLDDHHRLVVDRAPRMGRLARSTPELVVQRLAATTRGDEAAIFAQLAAALGARGTPLAVVHG